MSQYNNLIFDLDDTLVVCGAYYIEVRNVYKQYQEARTGVPADVVDKMLSDFDLSCIKLPNAFSRARYPRSFSAISAALDIANGKEVDFMAMHLSYEIANKVFTADYRLFNGVTDMLIKYKQEGKKLFLCTKGDEEIQNFKIDKHNLRDLFDTIYIVPLKRGQEVAGIMADNNLTAAETLFIGDSLKDDVGSAHAAGIHAVHIHHPDKPAWSYDDGKNTPEFTLSQVTDLPTIIPHVT